MMHLRTDRLHQRWAAKRRSEAVVVRHDLTFGICGQPATTMRVRSAMDRLPDGKAQRGHPEKNHHPKPPYQPLLRSDNPRNDYRGDSHHHRSLTIQQLFEDFHLKRDAAETSGSEPKKASSSGTTSIASTSSIDPLKRRTSALEKKSSLASKSSASPKSKLSSASMATPSMLTAEGLLSVADQANSRRGSAKSFRRSSIVTSGLTKEHWPMSGTDAIKHCSAKLTDCEKLEILEYRAVYFLGCMSAKKTTHTAEERNEGFDDEDNFYISKPHDHLQYRYEIQDLLGKGTFGQVVRAIDHKTHSVVAVKIVKNERPFLRQAREEIRILELLKKQDKTNTNNIVHILDSFYFRGHICIVFELLGISLHQLLKKSRGRGFSLSRVQRITKAILRCLEVLHRNKIIHCDLKPENILLRRSANDTLGTGIGNIGNNIKVIDFGSSCYEQQQIYSYIQSRYYRAPEVILGLRYTCAIDMWSLACVIGELFTSEPLFAGHDECDQLACIMEVRGNPPTALLEKSRRTEKLSSALENRTAHRKPPMSVHLASLLRNCEDSEFLDFMRRALTWDPTLRLTAADGLLHPWIAHGSQVTTECQVTTESKVGNPLSDPTLGNSLKVKIPDKKTKSEANNPVMNSNQNASTVPQLTQHRSLTIACVTQLASS